MAKVKLVETENQRRLHIGSYFVDLNESEYWELVKIFSTQTKRLLMETAMRCQIALPENEQSAGWFDEGLAIDKSGDFMERLFEALELGNEKF